MKSVGLVPEFHVLISVQTSAVFILYPGWSYELVEHSESVNTADIAILFN
jgi:hypothetical protein